MAKEEESSNRNYLSAAFFGALWIIFIKVFWPQVIPFEVFSFWKPKGGMMDWLFSSWPVFVWGIVVTIVFQIWKSLKDPSLLEQLFREPTPGEILARGALISIWAGVVEEICFRWILFLDAIISVKILNFLFFGFLGFGVPEWLHLNIFGPIANFTTLHHLDAQLFHKTGWAVGAAMLSVNAFFRDSHRYQGTFGYINSWFVGMFFFWIMFTYGLPAAILVHFLYDLLIDVTAAAGAFVRQH